MDCMFIPDTISFQKVKMSSLRRNSIEVSEDTQLINIHVYDAYSTSTIFKVYENTIGTDVCKAVSSKNNISAENAFYHHLVLVVTLRNTNRNFIVHCLRTIKGNEVVIDIQNELMSKLSKRFSDCDIHKDTRDLMKWYYKDSRTPPIDFGDAGDVVGEYSSDDEESSISHSDLAYLGKTERKGYLLKRSSKDENLWEKKYCVLTDHLWCINIDSIYNQAIPKAVCVKLNGIVKERRTSSNSLQVIKISSPKQTHYFRALNSSDQNKWLNQLNMKTEQAIDNDIFNMAEVIICDEETSKSERLHKKVDELLDLQSVYATIVDSIERIGFSADSADVNGDVTTRDTIRPLDGEAISPNQQNSLTYSHSNESVTPGNGLGVDIQRIVDSSDGNYSPTKTVSFRENSTLKDDKKSIDTEDVQLEGVSSSITQKGKMAVENEQEGDESSEMSLSYVNNTTEANQILITACHDSNREDCNVELMMTSPEHQNGNHDNDDDDEEENAEERNLPIQYSHDTYDIIQSHDITYHIVNNPANRSTKYTLLHRMHFRNKRVSDILSFIIEVQKFKELYRHDLFILIRQQQVAAILIYSRYILPQIQLSKSQVASPNISTKSRDLMYYSQVNNELLYTDTSTPRNPDGSIIDEASDVYNRNKIRFRYYHKYIGSRYQKRNQSFDEQRHKRVGYTIDDDVVDWGVSTEMLFKVQRELFETPQNSVDQDVSSKSNGSNSSIKSRYHNGNAPGAYKSTVATSSNTAAGSAATSSSSFWPWFGSSTQATTNENDNLATFYSNSTIKTHHPTVETSPQLLSINDGLDDYLVKKGESDERMKKAIEGFSSRNSVKLTSGCLFDELVEELQALLS